MLNHPPPNDKCGPAHAPLRRYKALKIEMFLPVIEKIFQKFKNFNKRAEFLKFLFRFWYIFMTSRGDLPPPPNREVRPNVEIKYWVEPPRSDGYGRSAILASPMGTIQAVVAMVTVPFAMRTGLIAMEI